jgi:anti-sigma factor RsiW
MITRENYEEFFLLYIDNELSVAARAAVERFVDENPDLREEWETFLQCRVQPEAEAIFPYKNDLLKEEHETLFLSYVDGELGFEDRAAVEDIIGSDPSSAAELQRLLLTVSEPDLSVVFPDKERLYRTERRRRLVPLLWMRAGVAAAVLTAGAFLFLSRPHGKGSLPVAVTVKKAAGPVTPRSATPLYIEKAQVKNSEIKTDEARRGTIRAAEKRSVKGPLQDVTVKAGAQKDRPIAAPVFTTDTGSTTRDVTITATTKPDKTEALPVPVVNTLAVSIPKDQSSFATQALLKESQENEADNMIAADESNVSAPPGKTKLRRIFRRVTRAFGKTADRDDDGQRQVLISAFQVALK